MAGDVVEFPRDAIATAHAAEQLLGEGIPFTLNVRAARAYLTRCKEVLARLLELPNPSAELTETILRLQAASLIAATQTEQQPCSSAADRLRARTARLPDDITRVYADLAWAFCHSGPEFAATRSELASQAISTATRHHAWDVLPASYSVLFVALLEQGEIRSLDAELLEGHIESGRVDRLRQADPVAWFECLRSILDGDTAAAEYQADALYATAMQNDPLNQTDARALHATQIGMIRWMQGRVHDAEDRFLAARREHPEQLLWSASLAWLWLLQGRRQAAEALLHTLPEPEQLLRDRYWLSTMTVLAEIACIHGPRDRAERIRGLLAPYADRLVAVGVGIAFWGTCARTLGLLEERLGLLADARDHLELAIETSARIGALAWHAEAQIELAEFALRHDLQDIPAYELLTEARTTSQARGFTALERRSMQRPQIRVLGAFEVISLCGNPAVWTSRKARDLLKMLVAARGVATSREIFMDALWPGEPPSRLGNRFSVAINTVRRSLDPQRLMPTQHHVITEGDSVRLDLEQIDIDLERFHLLARRDDATSREQARQLYRGDAFSDEPYADWAVDAREMARQTHAGLDAYPRRVP